LHAIEGTATLPPTSCLVQAALIDGADAAGVLERDLQDFFSPIAKDKIIFAPYRNRLAVFFRDIQEGEALRLLERFSARRRNRVDIALGPQCSGTTGAPAWRESFRTAEELIKQAFFYKEKLVLHSSPQTGSNNYLKIFENRTLELSAFIKLIDPEKIKVFFKNFEYEAINSGKNPQEIREEYITLLIQTRDLVEKDFPTLKDLSSKKMLDLCIEAPYLADISENFSRFFIGYSQNLPRISADSAFQRILTYVRNNYTQPLCLKTISQLFNQNPAYLGKLWKKQTGFKFHTYLDKLRIEAATELLLQTNMKVYEIAKAVGYEDPDYFYTKFKKHSGKSPLDFRRT
jgi:two-component system response regulator YesN